ncbi:tyrosine-type recombinase/integrase [Haloplanus rubicundus]|uniref:Site-specific integrase n=1 Tax=Haloplanus rubicundus TaxID=1547898 RepID=A0A345EHJ5_9EURY|nr:tyrosine-type recombinase/integrase [Haloplanus rubicundus]AXG11667.1 site-specific integrase [Haloplanus rubicundus]
MVTNPDRRLEMLREQLEGGEREVADEDRELLLAFDDRMALLPSEYGKQRREKLLRHCTVMAEGEGNTLADALTDKEAAEGIVRWIHDEHDPEETPETNKDFRIALRMFGKRVVEHGAEAPTDDDGFPESMGWIPTTTSRNYDPTPDPAKMLDWDDDVLPMIDATMNARDAALIAVAFDAGPRAGELLDLRVGDVSDHTHGFRISVDGKKGQRSVTLITSVPFLERWLADHPRSDDSTAPLWCKLRSGEEISYQMARKIPRQAADHAGVEKPVTFTNFRKSSASFLASRGVNQPVLEDHHGWTRGSKAAARYISVFSEASDREVARAHGVDVSEEEPDPIAAVTCPRCGRDTPRSEEFCMWCHQAIEHGAVDELEEVQESQRRQLLGLAKDHPELLDRLEEMEPLVEALGGDPDVIKTARRFVDETDE